MEWIKKNISFKILIIISLTLSVYRISNVSEKEISWDVLGYYLPLPATFIYDDPMLSDTDWLKKINEEKELSGTLYMVSSNDEGESMYFFLFGMALFYLPFFLIGHFLAMMTGFPVDGFSMPYQYALVAGGIVYTLIGLFFLRKVLNSFFSEKITSIVLLIIVFATNYTHHLTLKNLETVNVLFMLVTILIWYTMQWHRAQKLKYLIAIGLSITLMTLVKPSEILIFFIPILWNVYSLDTWKQKVKLILSNKKQFFITIFLCFLVASPQMFYWFSKTGSLFYDTYKNPGVGLDIFSPHIIDSLFSYRKGWLLYTPVMIFSLWGLYLMYKNNKNISLSVIFYFVVSFYIISCWSEWWYGAGFSNRPVITVYPLLAIGLGFFIDYLSKQRQIIKIAIGVLICFFTFLNHFQWWQLKNYILDPYRTTKEYYWATFLKTSVSEEDKGLLLVARDFSGKMEFNNKEKYTHSVIKELTFSTSEEKEVLEENGNRFYRISKDQEFALTDQIRYKRLTDEDHAWVSVSFDLRCSSDFTQSSPCFVFTFDRKEGNYGYYAPEIKQEIIDTNWRRYKFEYLTPEVRNEKDYLKYYIWNKGHKTLDIDNLKVEVYEKN